MRTYIERKLKEIKRISDANDLWLSCDIYYNDVGEHLNEQFVVWVHSNVTHIDLHFRSNHIRKSLKMALKWLKNLR